MKRYPLSLVLFICVLPFGALSQDTSSMLNNIEWVQPKKELVSGIFKSSRVINGHSVEMIGKKVLDFRILHRFGNVNDGLKELFGLDKASMRMSFDYGITNNLTAGFARSTYRKELDAFLKYRLLAQSTGLHSSPFTVILVAGTTIIAEKNLDTSKTVTLNTRTGYYYQVLLGRKFSKKFSLQIAPTMVHRNFVKNEDENDIYALGAGGRYLVSKRVAWVIDYFYVFNGLAEKSYFNPLSIGVDIETGGHVFQLHFSNATGMNERSFITETIHSWKKKEIKFGFNLSRIFYIGKKKIPLDK